jgi:hypothetical protein
MGALIGGAGLFIAKSLFGAGAAGGAQAAPGLVPQGAFGSGPVIFVMRYCEEGEIGLLCKPRPRS